MLKRIMLIVLVCVSGLQAAHASNSRFKERVKQSRIARVWKGTVLPGVVSFFSCEWITRACGDKPGHKVISVVAHAVTWVSVCAGLLAWEYWLKTQMPKHIFAKSKTRSNEALLNT